MPHPRPAPAHGESVATRILGLLPSLGPGQRSVADVVLADPAGAAALTIDGLAARAGTSLSAVTRLSRTLGLQGYSELRLLLAAESARGESEWSQAISDEIGPDDSVETLVSRLVRSDVLGIQDSAAALDLATLATVADALVAARHIGLSAVSGSAAITQDFALKLTRIGRSAALWSDVHDALTACALLGPADVVVGVTHSGETREVIEPLREARERGALTVVVTNHPRSTAGRVARHVLRTATRDTTFRSGGPASRHAQLLVLDCLYLRLAQLTFDDTERALAATSLAVNRIRRSRA